MQGTVRALFVALEKKSQSLPLDEVRVAATGFDRDFHTKTATRQILMISDKILREFDLKPGALHENMVVDGVDVMTFNRGQRLQIGDVVLEVTIACEPCVQMDRLRPGLKKALDGKRGMFAKVVTAGTIRVGDIVSS
jgi:MOSC domain-containing protein YiiM